MENRYFVFFTYLVSSLSSKIQRNNSLQSNSEQQKNHLFQTKRSNDFVQKVNWTFSGGKKSENSVSGQLLTEENFIPVRARVCVKVRVSFRVGGGKQTIAPKENCSLLGLVLGLGEIFFGGNCSRTRKLIDFLLQAGTSLLNFNKRDLNELLFEQH